MAQSRLLKNWRMLLFVFSVLLVLIIPVPQPGGLYDPEALFWPFSEIETTRNQVLLNNMRVWIVKPMVLFSGILYFGHLLSGRIVRKQNNRMRHLIWILALLLFLLLLYVTCGAVLFMGPLYPLTMSQWIRLFGTEYNFVYVWWGMAAILFEIGCIF